MRVEGLSVAVTRPVAEGARPRALGRPHRRDAGTGGPAQPNWRAIELGEPNAAGTRTVPVASRARAAVTAWASLADPNPGEVRVRPWSRVTACTGATATAPGPTAVAA